MLCVDEKSQCQALERTQPLLTLGLGYVEGVTHGYLRHFTPTHASWLNQVEIRFHLITQKAIRRGSFTSVTQLKEKIRRFTEHYNPKARPFVWTATADSILHKIQRLCMAISGTEH